MRPYASADLRNVAILGHAHSGKTALVSAILKTARIPAGSARDEDGAVDVDEEEIARGMTMANSVSLAEWDGVKVNLIDTPGFHMFVHDARGAMLPAESAVIVVNARAGIESVTDTVWSYASEVERPRMIVISQVDRPDADALTRRVELLDALRARWGRQVVPVQLPIVSDKGFCGVVDLITMEAYYYTPDDGGLGAPRVIPPELEAEARTEHEALVELVAEGKDELMEEFFSQGTIPQDHLVAALHQAIREDRIFPVLYVSGLRNVGTDRLLDFLKVYAPSPAERTPFALRRQPWSSGNGSAAAAPADGTDEIVTREATDTDPATLYVYKTIIDPFAGRISCFKVISGCIKPDASFENYVRGETEKLAHPSIMQGRKLIGVAELHAGDLGAVSKLRVTQTGDTLGPKGQRVLMDPVRRPEPVMTYAIEPKTRADEDKLGPALHKLMEEDLFLHFYRDPQTNEFLLAGMGQLHIEAVVSRLRRRYHTEVNLKSPQVPYRETIRAKAVGHGRHKKQSGGHGQFADCKIRLEPLARGGGFEFVNDIFGGSIPRQFVPAVQKGVQESAARGFLAGYPVVDFRASVFDGSYHEVDSSEMAFKIAGRAAFRACMEQAKPALLEPVMRVDIEVPDEFAGAVLGDINSRRSRVQSTESGGGKTIIRSHSPLAELLSYGTTLTSLTQGRGTFRMEMDHYDFVPQMIADKITAGAKHTTKTDEDE
ncbi:MAG: elongation factor G [Acidobacteriaceae bacterium]